MNFVRLFHKLILSTFLILLSTLFTAQVDSVYFGNRKKENQKEQKKSWTSNDWTKSLVWGGTFQAWFGNQTFVFLSPSVAYPVYKNVLVGIGGIYNYSSYKGPGWSYSQSIFGGQSFVRYIIRDSYFIQGSYDRLLQPNFLSVEPNDKTWVDYLMFGGGFRHALSEHSAFNTSLMYYVNPSPLSIYPSRIIVQFGFTASLN